LRKKFDYLKCDFQDSSSSSSGKSLVQFARGGDFENIPGSICGLEISFSSVPQDIDVKLISAGDAFDVKGN
jgi:hypothetical protein